VTRPAEPAAQSPETNAHETHRMSVAKARGWIDDIRVGAIGSFAEIAERETQGAWLQAVREIADRRSRNVRRNPCS
jgi:hypothetical protein